jgi:hypothetical protein
VDVQKKKWAKLPPFNTICQMNEYIKNLKLPIAIVGMGKRKMLQNSLPPMNVNEERTVVNTNVDIFSSTAT